MANDLKASQDALSTFQRLSDCIQSLHEKVQERKDNVEAGQASPHSPSMRSLKALHDEDDATLSPVVEQTATAFHDDGAGIETPFSVPSS